MSPFGIVAIPDNVPNEMLYDRLPIFTELDFLYAFLPCGRKAYFLRSAPRGSVVLFYVNYSYFMHVS